ncbi:hypothetical protein ABIA32_000586 [Streptacidiphilus sp. MAP12-20]
MTTKRSPSVIAARKGTRSRTSGADGCGSRGRISSSDSALTAKETASRATARAAPSAPTRAPPRDGPTSREASALVPSFPLPSSSCSPLMSVGSQLW